MPSYILHRRDQMYTYTPPTTPRPRNNQVKWENYDTICTNPYAIEILSATKSLPRKQVLENLTTSQRKGVKKSSRKGGNEKMLQPTERITISKRKKKGGAGRNYSDEMDVCEARMINLETERNVERDDVVWEENWPTEDEVLHGEYFRCLFPGFREAMEVRMLEEGRRGLWACDRELREMNILYDSEDKDVMDRRTPAAEPSPMPVASPPEDEADWEIVDVRADLPRHQTLQLGADWVLVN
ncbi:hypothetical protein TWF481_011938 [Arthrobotrys musiformis]|uniref:Uncharacterized protein n=1 Tax=Arthrobotrys musiformis TaxID=47236 RepID=A0AAV9VVQ0_9PEZI